jgi:hypothetical protein
LNQSYVLDTGVLLNLVRGKELGSRIDRQFGLSRSMRLHTISIVTHGELKVLGERNEWGPEKRSVLAVALDNLVTVNIGRFRTDEITPHHQKRPEFRG